MSGLSWWAQAHWIDRQRKLWRQHDARLAAAWRETALPAGDDADVGAHGDGVTSPDVGGAAEPRRVVVLPGVVTRSASSPRDAVRS